MATKFIPTKAKNLKRGDRVWTEDKFHVLGYAKRESQLQSDLIITHVEAPEYMKNMPWNNGVQGMEVHGAPYGGGDRLLHNITEETIFVVMQEV